MPTSSLRWVGLAGRAVLTLPPGSTWLASCERLSSNPPACLTTPSSPLHPPQIDQAVNHMQLWRHKLDSAYTINAYDLTDLQPDRDLLDLI